MKKINFIITLALLISLSLIANVSALDNNLNTCPMGGTNYALNGSYGSGTMILSWTISILLVVLLIAGIYWFVKSANNKTNGGKK